MKTFVKIFSFFVAIWGCFLSIALLNDILSIGINFGWFGRISHTVFAGMSTMAAAVMVIFVWMIWDKMEWLS